MTWRVKTVVGWGILVFVVLAATAWAVGEWTYPGDPPERNRSAILSARSESILRRACFDCHSNEPRRPWYAHLPVAGLLMANHIREGRAALNFSRWDRMDARKRAEAINESLETIAEGEMPTIGYVLFNPDAALTRQDLAQLRRDARAAGTGGEGDGTLRNRAEDRDEGNGEDRDD